ncbi:MAG: TMEM165/GDT1 family protein [Ilumatobacteraceae bacterium]
MDLAAVVAAFATVFVAELPDKTMLATIVLSARFRRPRAVWIGAATALTTQMAIAAAAGQLLSLLPSRVVSAVVAVLFASGAVVLWRSADDDAEGVTATAGPDLAVDWWRVSVTVFGVVFLAEWGDLTQLATASLASQRHAVSVFVGAAVAMLSVAAIGVIAGRALLRVLPEHLLRRIAAGIFTALAIVAAINAIRG